MSTARRRYLCSPSMKVNQWNLKHLWIIAAVKNTALTTQGHNKHFCNEKLNVRKVLTELLIQRSPACCPFHGGPTHLQTDLWEWEGAAGWTGNSPVLTEYGRVSGQQQQQPGSLLHWDYKVENSSIHCRLHKLWALNSISDSDRKSELCCNMINKKQPRL